MSIVAGVNFPVDKCPGVSYRKWKLAVGSNCPGGNFSMWELSKGHLLIQGDCHNPLSI